MDLPLALHKLVLHLRRLALGARRFPEFVIEVRLHGVLVGLALGVDAQLLVGAARPLADLDRL